MSRKQVNQNNNPNDNTINLDENNITAMNLKQSSNLGLNKSQNTKLTAEKNKKKKEEEDDANEALKKNLMFTQRNISPIKLYCHLSTSTEVLLMFFRNNRKLWCRNSRAINVIFIWRYDK